MLTDFLNYNHSCPLCGEPLNLYMQWVGNYRANGVLFSGQVKDNIIQFIPNITCQTDEYLKREAVLLELGSEINSDFSHNELLERSKRTQIYFFFLCNPKGIKYKDDGKWKVSLYKGCYYRSTPFFEYKLEDKSFKLRPTSEPAPMLANKDESFSINTYNEGLEKVYMMQLDYELNKTVIYHYSITDEQKQIKGFEPNTFEKDLPLLKNRPDLSQENRQKLVDRFNNWILMS